MERDADLVCVVAASSAWPAYLATSSYVCPPGRAFRDADRLGFYSSGQVHELLPRIEHVEPSCSFTPGQVFRRALSADPNERRVGMAAAAALDRGVAGDRATLVLLSAPTAPQTVRIRPLRHEGASAWVTFQRFVSLDALRVAGNTDDLDEADHAER